MSNINYLDIIKKAWKITWRNKYLWWFGFFVALSGSGCFFQYSTQPENNAGDFGRQLSDFMLNHAGLFLAGLIAFLLIFIVIFVLSILSRGALIKSIEKTSKGETSSFKAGLKESKKYFWKIFLLSLLIGLALLAVILVLAMPIVFLFVAKSFVLGTLLAIAAIAILIPLCILAYFLRIFGFIYIVLGELSLSDAVENAYNLFLKNIGASFLMALIFIPLGLAMGFGFLLILFPLAIIFLVLGLVLFLILNQLGAVIAITLAIITAGLIFLLVRSGYEVFSQAIWIFFFHAIAKPKVTETVSGTAAEETPAPSAAPDPVIFLDK